MSKPISWSVLKSQLAIQTDEGTVIFNIQGPDNFGGDFGFYVTMNELQNFLYKEFGLTIKKGETVRDGLTRIVGKEEKQP